MQCLIINRNYPPNSGITGYSAHVLAEYLTKNGVDVTIVTTDAIYGGMKHDLGVGRVVQIKSVYSGKNRYLRLASSLYESFRLAQCAASMKVAPWISMTDPPLLNIWVGLKAKKLNIPWAYWSMDLYPDAFIAAGLLNKTGFLYKFINSQLIKAAPNFLISLGNLQATYIKSAYQWNMPTVVLPCGISAIDSIAIRPNWASKKIDVITFGYIGNIGEAHSAEFLIEAIRQICIKNYQFILCIHGKHSRYVLESVKNISNLVVLDFISSSELHFIDVHLITLLPKWDHICVPSKTVTSICKGGAILYCGSQSGDNWSMFEDCGWRIDPKREISEQIRIFLSEINSDSLNCKKNFSKNHSKNLMNIQKNSFKEIYNFIKNN